MSQPSYGSPGSSGDAPSPSYPQQSDTPTAPPQPSAPPSAPQSAPPQFEPQFEPPHSPQGQGWYGPTQPGGLSPQDERNWAMGAHLSSFVAAWIALGVLGPLTVLLVNGNRSAFVRRHAVEAVNWNISALIYLAISIPLMFILVGFLTAGAVAICYLVFTIMGAMAASRGEEFRYPLTIRFVK